MGVFPVDVQNIDEGSRGPCNPVLASTAGQLRLRNHITKKSRCWPWWAIPGAWNSADTCVYERHRPKRLDYWSMALTDGLKCVERYGNISASRRKYAAHSRAARRQRKFPEFSPTLRRRELTGAECYAANRCHLPAASLSAAVGWPSGAL